MSNQAVTDDSAPSNFLPEGKEYRMTGVMPEKEEKEVVETKEVKSENLGESATPADAQEDSSTSKPQGKTAASSESRWAKLSRENRELREQFAKYQAERNQPEVKREPVAPQAATETKGRSKPTGADKDATGNAKYSTMQAYLDDLMEWNNEQAISRFQEQSAKAQREQQQAQSKQLIEKTVNDRVEAARKTYADYDSTIADVVSRKDKHGNDALFYTEGSPIDGFFLDSDKGQDVMYEVAKNFDKYAHIFERNAQGQYLLNPIRQMRELSKIEASLEAKPVPTVPAVTKAPRPPNQVSGKGTVMTDAVEQAVKDNDFESYRQAQNAKALLRFKKG